MTKLADIIRDQFGKRRVVILGDIVADQFLHGTISRVSREAPVFILNHDGTDTRAGGAANAAVNIASLGGKPVLVGLMGNDSNGMLLRETLLASNVDCQYIVSDDRLQTTTKVRVLAGQQHAPRQQVIRIDYAHREPIDGSLKATLKANLAQACKGADAVIVSDYNYGAADPEIADIARRISVENGIPLIVDSRFRLAEFPGAVAATPNQEEAEQILGKDFTPESCSDLRERLGYKALLVTCGSKGMTLYTEGEPARQLEAVGSKEPIDVTGAGDTVIGAFALGLASGLSFFEAASVANHAGGIVVMKRGTASLTTSELLASLELNPGDLTLATPSP
ncbi:MAG: PfkB family carbohydrate kinase [Pyrinomonadaceae bacterium]